MECPNCKQQATRAIYLAFPLWLCTDERCMTVFGFWSEIVMLAPITTWDEDEGPVWKFMRYKGSYLKALWHWMFLGEEN